MLQRMVPQCHQIEWPHIFKDLTFCEKMSFFDWKVLDVLDISEESWDV